MLKITIQTFFSLSLSLKESKVTFMIKKEIKKKGGGIIAYYEGGPPTLMAKMIIWSSSKFGLGLGKLPHMVKEVIQQFPMIKLEVTESSQ